MARRDDRRPASSRRHGRSFSGRESAGTPADRTPVDDTPADGMADERLADGARESYRNVPAGGGNPSDSLEPSVADDRDSDARMPDPHIATGDPNGDDTAANSDRMPIDDELSDARVDDADARVDDADAHEDDRYDDDRYDDELEDDRLDSDAGAPQSRQRRVRRGRRRISGTMRLVITAAVVVLLVVLAITAYASPLMSVRTFHVNGLQELQRDRIIELARIPMGTPLLQIDTRPAATRIAALPRVKSVRVSRNYPSGIDINITERVAVAVLNRDGAMHVIDVDGIDFATMAKPSKLPVLEGTTDPSTPASRAALTVVSDLPPSLHRITQSVSADSPANVRLTLTDKRTVVWGDAQDDAAKSRSLSYLLTQQGTEYNVSAPQYPTYR